ncbi:ATP-binding cassette domain-containing protein [Xanthomonas axonopodis pv. desmodiigangetici]|uniref:ATP-binding cassette domain-containing protein n=1 Tax=Xanthomonas axonopodis TaxID=53413 RepID=UPI003556CCDE
MFTLDRVSRRYGQAIALDAVSLTFASGITTALIGPSGAGKSTVLRMLVGLEWPDSGTVAFDGTPLQRANLQAQRQRIGYVIQEGGLFPHLDARSNVTLLAQTLGWTRERIEARLDVLCALCQLPTQLLARYPAELSGGQRQRVGLIRALMLDPPALLLDEPLGALDPIVRYDLQAQMRELFAQLGNVAEAAYLADNLVLMRAGRIVQQGRARDLLEQPADAFVQRFLTAQRSIGDAA